MAKSWRAGLGVALAVLLAAGSLPVMAASSGPKGLFIPADKVDELVAELSELSGLPEEQVREKLEAAGREVQPRPRGPRFHHMGRHHGPGERWFGPRDERVAERMEERMARMQQWMADHLQELLEDGRISQEDYDRLTAALEARDWETLREYAREHWRELREQCEKDNPGASAPEGGAPAEPAPEPGAPNNG